MVNSERGLVRRARRAFALSPDTRVLKRELAAGNRYAHAKLARLGLAWRDGMIQASGRG